MYFTLFQFDNEIATHRRTVRFDLYADDFVTARFTGEQRTRIQSHRILSIDSERHVGQSETIDSDDRWHRRNNSSKSTNILIRLLFHSATIITTESRLSFMLSVNAKNSRCCSRQRC